MTNENNPPSAPGTGLALLPCPFCGGADIDPEGWMDGDHNTGPTCNECGASAESTAGWNRRAANRAPVYDELPASAASATERCVPVKATTEKARRVRAEMRATLAGLRALAREPVRETVTPATPRPELTNLLIEAEALLCDERGGQAANELARRIRAALSHAEQVKP